MYTLQPLAAMQYNLSPQQYEDTYKHTRALTLACLTTEACLSLGILKLQQLMVKFVGETPLTSLVVSQQIDNLVLCRSTVPAMNT